MATYSQNANIGVTPLNTGAYVSVQQPQQYRASPQSPITAEWTPGVYGNTPYMTGPNQLPSPVTQPPPVYPSSPVYTTSPVYTSPPGQQMSYMPAETVDHSAANKKDQLKGLGEACGIVAAVFVWIVGFTAIVTGILCECICYMLPN